MGKIVAIGAPYYDSNNGSNSGHVRVYHSNATLPDSLNILGNLDISGNVTLKGANSKFIGDVSGDVLGNAATATALTSGDQTIDGKLGIGTTNLSHKLTVVGNTKLTGDFEQTNNLMHFIRMQLPQFGSPQGATSEGELLKGYIILGRARVVPETHTNNVYPHEWKSPASYAIGKIIMRRGANNANNNIDVYNVTSSKGFLNEVFHVNLEFDGTGSHTSKFSRLVKCTYDFIEYHAIETTGGGGGSTHERTFEGYAVDAALVFVDQTYVSNVEPFGTIGMSIEGSGNVGIGTSTPNETLDVSGNANIDGSANITGNLDVVGNLTVGDTNNYTKIDANNNFVSFNTGQGGSLYIKAHEMLNKWGGTPGENEKWTNLYFSLDETQSDTNLTGIFHLKIELYGAYTGASFIYLHKQHELSNTNGDNEYSYTSTDPLFDVSAITLYDKGSKIYFDVELSNSDAKRFSLVNIEVYNSQNGIYYHVSNLNILGTDKTYGNFSTDILNSNTRLFTYVPFRHKELVVTGSIDAQWKKKLTTTGVNGQYLGTSIATSYDGSRIIVGAYKHNSPGTWNGKVSIYDYDGSSLSEIGTKTGESNVDYFGYDVAMSSDGSRIIVGAYGHSSWTGKVYIYDYDGSSWVPNGTKTGEANSDHFGYSVAMSSDGNRIVVGAHNNDSKGTVYIYDYDYDGSWNKIGTITGRI